jgi:membrane-bound lytic murein transglycosylase B
MNKARNLKAFALGSFLCVALCCLIDSAFAGEDAFALLKERLIADSFSPQQVTMAYEPDPGARFRTVAQTLRMRESKLNYNQFLSPLQISQAERFLIRNREVLSRAERKFGVDGSVIVGILLVETQLGRCTGQVPVLAVLSTFAIMDQRCNRDRVWALLPAGDRRRWDREAFDRKLKGRAEWAYPEVCALLRWADAQALDPQSFRGSIMGAIGWPQFLPSSLLHFAVDGNSDGWIDPYQSEDAIFSVANYLREHGWSDTADRTSHEQVIYTYNKSRPYVETILEIADRIRPAGGLGVGSHAADGSDLR